MLSKSVIFHCACLVLGGRDKGRGLTKKQCSEERRRGRGVFETTSVYKEGDGGYGVGIRY